jgi:hypothetical protein
MCEQAYTRIASADLMMPVALEMALLHNPPLLFNFRKQYDCDELSLEHCPGYAARLTERGIPRLVSLFMALMVSSDSTC